MIVLLLCYGTSYSKANYSSLYGGLGDSVLISYDDLRIANAKMIELNYEKEIHTKLREIIETDSIHIEKLNFVIEDNKRKIREAKTREYIAEGVSVLSLIALIIALCK